MDYLGSERWSCGLLVKGQPGSKCWNKNGSGPIPTLIWIVGRVKKNGYQCHMSMWAPMTDLTQRLEQAKEGERCVILDPIWGQHA
jgi:hypothetical protein